MRDSIEIGAFWVTALAVPAIMLRVSQSNLVFGVKRELTQVNVVSLELRGIGQRWFLAVSV